MCLFADDVSTRVASRKAGLVSGAVGKSRYLGLKTLIKLMVSPNGPDFSHRRRSIPAPRASAPGEIVRHSCFVTAWVRGGSMRCCHPARQQTAPLTTSEIVLTLDPSQSKIHWSVDSTLHTVHGTFALKS